MEIIDNKRKCLIEGCNNLGEWHNIDNGKVKRRKICSKHKRLKYNMFPRKLSAVKRFKNQGKCNKCELCGWEGPCDCHRKIYGKVGGRYIISNLRSICPNCHRLIHTGKLTIKD